MTPDTLLSLALRCEQASADEQWSLLREAGDALLATGDFGKRDRFSRFLNSEAYESAAMLLLPEGCAWQLGECEGVIGACVWPNPDSMPVVNAATPALAFTAASLRARASQESQG
jgi:hypothetical protein